MATYTIIGGDKKEYGPITADDMRQWIVEGRLNTQSLAKSETDTAWRTLGSFPEFADAFAIAAPATIAPLRSGATDYSASVDFMDRDYELDIGGCVSRGWGALKNNFGTLFGGFLIVGLIIVAVSGLLNLILTAAIPKQLSDIEAVRQIHNLVLAGLLALIAGPLMGGVYHIFIQAVRQLPVNIGDVFIGFGKNYKQLFLGYLIVALVGGLCLIPYNVVNDGKVLPILDQIQHAQPADVQNLLPQLWSAMFSTLPILLICMIPLTYLTVNLLFTLPLIVDKQMSFWPAIKTSWKMVHKHWWQVFGLTIVVGLVSASGFLGCCIGILITIPIGTATVMGAYETIFGVRKN